ncbi:MAG: hypothetical protein ABH983_01890 [Candidatus Micrarchaeota archaeon]|nr:hypothetical protein [Candidatus Micrarchaeota archaeon]
MTRRIQRSQSTVTIRNMPSYAPIIETLNKLPHAQNHVSDVPTLVKMLKSSDFSSRSKACVDITELSKREPEKARETFPALIEAFEKWGGLTKCIVSEALVALGDARAFPTLIRAANNPHPETRDRIRLAISRIPALELRVIES